MRLPSVRAIALLMTAAGPVIAQTPQQQTVQQALGSSRQYLQVLQADDFSQAKELSPSFKLKLYEATKASLDKSLPADCKVHISRLQFLATMDPTIGNPGASQKKPQVIKYFAESLDTAEQSCNETTGTSDR
jgi:hypothetical protein